MYTFLSKLPVAGLALVALTLTTACQNPSSAQLVAAPTAQAAGQFTQILDLAVDSKDQIYVIDAPAGTGADAKMTLHRMAADGTVTTLAGTADVNAPIVVSEAFTDANLVGLRGIDIQDDVLYLSGLNCLRSVSLESEPLMVKTHWGQCLTAEAYQEALAGTGLQVLNKPSLFNHYINVTADQTIFADASADGKSRQVLKINPGNKEPENLLYADLLLGMTVDHQGALFLSHPWPALNDGPGYIQKIVPGQRASRLHEGFGQLISDKRGNLYLLQDGKITRFAASGHSKSLGSIGVQGLVSDKLRMVMNPSESSLIISTGTSIYRFPLPQD